MVEFLQSYGILIFFGLLFFLMMRRHGHGGMGCGMGGHQHSSESESKLVYDEPDKEEGEVRVVTEVRKVATSGETSAEEASQKGQRDRLPS